MKLTLLAWMLLASTASAKETVLFDTDSAYLNDDGLALAALLSRPDLVDVAGVTVESGNVWRDQGVEYELALLERLGRTDVPVYLGSVEPLKNSPARAAEVKRRWGGGFMFPLDATNKVKLTETLAKELSGRGAPLSAQLREDFSRYPGFFSDAPHRDWVYVWDFLVSAWLIEPSAFAAPKPAFIVVDDRFGPSYGRSDVSFKAGGAERASVDVVVDADETKVLSLLSSLFPRKER